MHDLALGAIGVSPAAARPRPLVGREAELAAIDGLLADGQDQGGTLLLRGAPGIGATTLLAEAVRRAEALGMAVLRTAGFEAERDFPFAGLHQLLRPLSSWFEDLPAPQRQAMMDIFGVSDGAGENAGFSVGLATLGLIARGAAERPTLICLDDAQWLDGATIDAVAFVARRLRGQRVALLVAARDGGSEIAELDFPELHLEPLAATAAAALLDTSSPRPDAFVRERVLREAAGNPLALAELPRALADAGDAVLLSPWVPVPASLDDAFAPGLAALPAITRQALLAAALNDGPSVDEALAAAALAAGAPVARADLGPALDVRLLTITGDRLRFAHRLTPSAIRSAATVAERHATHRALADVLAATPDRQVWHRAASADGLDDALAAELAAVAQRAGTGGLFTRAAAGMRRAALLTVDPVARSHRLLLSAVLAREIGGVDIAARLLRDVDPELLGAPDRARLLVLRESVDRGGAVRGEVEPAAMVTLARDAAAEGGREEALQLLWLAALAALAARWEPEAFADVIAATRAIADRPDAPALFAVLAVADPVGHGAEILSHIARAAPYESDPDAMYLLGVAALRAGDPHAAGALLAAGAQGARAQGRPMRRMQILSASTWASIDAAEWDVAELAALEALSAAERLELHRAVAVPSAGLALIAGVHGDEERAEACAARSEQSLRSTGSGAVLAMVQQGRGLSALAAGRPVEAYGHLRRIFTPADPAYDRDRQCWCIADLAEAAILGEAREDAVALLATVAPRTEQSPSALLRATLHLARVSLSDDAEADAAHAAALQDEVARFPFLHARLELAHGMRLRRHRRIADSRAPLRAAQAAFEALGAAPWAERARREVAATSESAQRGPEGSEQLTPQELEIALMAARGLSNREIGAMLALSHRTVGSHLARIYPKLGISSRGQIQAALPPEG